jgi:hypothetical protein
MVTEKEYLDKYYTTEGQIALETRLRTLSKLYIESIQYPFEAQMLGFIKLKIHSREHHQGMIDELCQILGKTKVEIKVK